MCGGGWGAEGAGRDGTRLICRNGKTLIIKLTCLIVKVSD